MYMLENLNLSFTWKIIKKRGSRFKTGNGNRFKKTDLTVDVKKKNDGYKKN